MLYERLALPVLFRLGRGDPERAHEWTLARLSSLSRRPVALAALRAIFAVNAPVEVFGLRFANPVGLAAGMDKDGLALAAWPALGFGFVEVGTVTSDPQQGNDGPRLHRLPESAAVINRMGFNNAGAAALARRLAAAQPLGVPLGISLGKSRSTPLAEAVGDYLRCLQLVYEYGDYFAVNVSSPNTPDLRGLQERAHLEQLLAALREGTRRLAGPDREPKPLLVKIDPDLTEPALAELVEVCLAQGVAGVIATNTTTERTGLAPADVVRADQPGGLSGAPLAARSRAVVAFVSRQAGGKLPIVGVGGVHHSDDARALVDAGASLVQLFTGLIYRGPGLVRRTARALRAARPATRVQDVPANRVYEGRRG